MIYSALYMNTYIINLSNCSFYPEDTSFFKSDKWKVCVLWCKCDAFVWQYDDEEGEEEEVRAFWD